MSKPADMQELIYLIAKEATNGIQQEYESATGLGPVVGRDMEGGYVIAFSDLDVPHLREDKLRLTKPTLAMSTREEHFVDMATRLFDTVWDHLDAHFKLRPDGEPPVQQALPVGERPRGARSTTLKALCLLLGLVMLTPVLWVLIIWWRWLL